ncbi:N-acyltransferase YncA [Candidatus Izimaplasma bacterium HR1]|jgi:ribosomal protein S18 acetylase RimI-like enzyme|uniref:GNAT family N-acetyltransferase n=1 Tax=Candidatus Izimoplasma sp. HR1 TaxID=1541959 RepID=UPI0004F6FB24|nr:N-acyltransferase YncA [Candidatus Izimaplasma bacterium HR1]
MIIRELTQDDYLLYKKIRLELLENETLSFGSSFEEESLFEDKLWKYRLDKENVTTIGAFINEEMIGICVVVFNPRSKLKHIASLHSMYVKKNHRGEGIGRQLIIHAEEAAKGKGIFRMNLSVVNSNEKAFILYQKLGFVKYGIEPDTIKISGEYYSLILMSKKL